MSGFEKLKSELKAFDEFPDDLLDNIGFLRAVQAIVAQGETDGELIARRIDGLAARIDGVKQAWPKRHEFVDKVREKKAQRQKRDREDRERIANAKKAVQHLRDAALLMGLPENHFLLLSQEKLQEMADDGLPMLGCTDQNGDKSLFPITPRLDRETPDEYEKRVNTLRLSQGLETYSSGSVIETLMERGDIGVSVIERFHDEVLYGNFSANVRTRGHAAADADSAARAAAIRCLDEAIPEDTENRYSAIAEILEYCGIDANRALVRSTLLSGKT